MDKLESGFLPGMLAGTIEVPKGTEAEKKYWMNFSIGAETINVDLDRPLAVEFDRWPLAETPMGGIVQQPVWQIDLVDNHCQLFLRDCNLPSSTDENKVCLFVSAGLFPRHWKDEMTYAYEDGRLAKTEDLKEVMRGAHLDFAFVGHTIWGKDENLALVSTLHLFVLEKMKVYDQLNYSKTTLNSKEKQKLKEVRDFMLRSGIISREGKDPDFDKFRSRMHEIIGPLEYDKPMTVEMKQKREEAGQRVIAEIAEAEYDF